eukprot:TRINITY_DN3608_c0_g1_i1.p1 TRINITY_DN3608_c0_g1~~TRINITY_DN3608_c0_g1_i1.p1  ORF type:complete len:104 (+),score=2.09 TRINITY_DN3608_c0_g1_i1:318-629(+)
MGKRIIEARDLNPYSLARRFRWKIPKGEPKVTKSLCEADFLKFYDCIALSGFPSEEPPPCTRIYQSYRTCLSQVGMAKKDIDLTFRQTLLQSIRNRYTLPGNF